MTGVKVGRLSGDACASGFHHLLLINVMDIQALKLELVQQLVSTNDATVLAQVKRLLEPLRAKAPGNKEEHEEELIAAAAIFGHSAYVEDEPDISGQVLKEPEPLPALQARLKRLIEEQQDAGLLTRVMAFIHEDAKADQWRAVLARRAAHAEADFAAGRVFTQEEVEARFKAKRSA